MTESPLLFLSHSGEDSEVAQEVARRLEAAGLRVWLDLDRLLPGDRWMTELENALDTADAFAVYVGRSGVRHWVDREVRRALDRATKDRDFRVIPILAPGLQPEVLPAFLAQHQAVRLEQEMDDGALRSLVGAVLEQPPATVPLVPADEPPFLSLRNFELEQSHLFFGRDRETAELLAQLREHRFLAVVGASGSGKSSLVRAGLVPALHRGRHFDSQGWRPNWRVATLRPADDPFRELAWALPDLDPTLTAESRIEVIAALRKSLASGSVDLGDCVAGLLPGSSHVLIVVDQFEELFSSGELGAEDRERFIETLLQAVVTKSDRPIYVVITLRADFFDHCWESPSLLKQIKTNEYLVERMGTEQLREVIERPVALAGGTLEEGLTETILNEVGSGSGNLPLLEHLLFLLWQRRQDQTLTHAAYVELGRLEGALRRHADEVFGGLSPAARLVARKVFVRLSHLGSGTEHTSRRARKQELLHLGDDPALAEEVLGQLTRARLLTATGGQQNGARAAVEVAHETLIREWSELRDWLLADRDQIRIERRLIQASREWSEADCHPDLLFAGFRLAQARQLERSRRRDLPPESRRFLAEGLKKERKRRLAEKRQAKQKIATQAALARKALAQARAEAAASEEANRAKRFLAILLAVAVLGVAVVLAVALYAFRQRNEAVRLRDEAIEQRDQLESRRLARQALLVADRGDGTQALALAIEAFDRSWTYEAEDTLRQLIRSAGGNLAATLPPPSSLMTGSVVFGDVVVEERGFIAHTGLDPPDNRSPLVRAAFSHNAEWLVGEAPSGRLEVWAKGSSVGRELIPDEGQTPFSQVAFSNDGLSVASVRAVLLSGDALVQPEVTEVRETIRVWRTKPKAIETAADGPAGTPPDSDADGPWRVDLTRTTQVANPIGFFKVAFGADDSLLLTVPYHAPPHVWALGSSSPISLGARPVNWAAFASRGSLVATAGQDRMVRVWTATTGVALAELEGHTDDVLYVAFSADDSKLVSTSRDGTARIWHLTSGNRPGKLAHGAGAVKRAAFHPDGRRLFTVGEDGEIRIWEADSGRPLATIVHPDGGAFADAEFSQFGETLLATDTQGKVLLWSLEKEAAVEMEIGASESLERASFSADPRRIVGVDRNGLARVWNLGSKGEVALLQAPAVRLLQARFGADGRSVLTLSADRRSLMLWDLSGRLEARLDTAGESILSAHHVAPGLVVMLLEGGRLAEWQPDSGLTTTYDHPEPLLAICTAAGDESVWAVDARGVLLGWRGSVGPDSARELGLPAVGQALFSPSCETLSASAPDGPAQVWSTATRQRLNATIDAAHTRSMVFSPDGRKYLTGLGSRSAAVFTVATGAVLRNLGGRTRGSSAAVFNNDGSMVLTIGADDKVRLWSVDSASAPIVLTGHLGRVRDATFSPEGDLVASASDDGTVRLWSTESGRLFSVLRGHEGPVSSVAFSADGRQLVSTGTDGTARIFAADVGYLLEVAESRLPADLTQAHREELLRQDDQPPSLPGS